MAKKKPLTKIKKKCRNSSKKKLLPNWVKKTPIRRTLIKAGHGHIRFAATFIKINSVHQLLSLYKRVGNQRKITIKLHHTHTLTNECMRTWVRNGKAVVCWKWSVSLFSPQLCSSFVKYNAIYNGIECPFFFLSLFHCKVALISIINQFWSVILMILVAGESQKLVGRSVGKRLRTPFSTDFGHSSLQIRKKNTNYHEHTHESNQRKLVIWFSSTSFILQRWIFYQH